MAGAPCIDQELSENNLLSVDSSLDREAQT